MVLDVPLGFGGSKPAEALPLRASTVAAFENPGEARN
jgi:hypothetical protein